MDSGYLHSNGRCVGWYLSGHRHHWLCVLGFANIISLSHSMLHARVLAGVVKQWIPRSVDKLSCRIRCFQKSKRTALQSAVRDTGDLVKSCE